MFRVKEFNYVIFDEAHMLKNMNTQRYEALVQFNVSITKTNNLYKLMFNAISYITYLKKWNKTCICFLIRTFYIFTGKFQNTSYGYTITK